MTHLTVSLCISSYEGNGPGKVEGSKINGLRLKQVELLGRTKILLDEGWPDLMEPTLTIDPRDPASRSWTPCPWSLQILRTVGSELFFMAFPAWRMQLAYPLTLVSITTCQSSDVTVRSVSQPDPELSFR